LKSNIPEVSVITACFNSDCFIEQTIKSVIGQTFTNFEFIIVDDCSSDKTVNIIKKYLRLDHRLKLYELSSNQGAAKARNYAINKSCGRFIAFLDSDDLWYKSKLKDQITFMLHNKYYFTYSYFQLVDEHSNFIKEVFVPRRMCYKRLLSYQAIGCLTAIYDRQYFGTVYMPEIKRRQDFALWLKLLKSVQYAHCIPKIWLHIESQKNHYPQTN